VDFFYLFQSQYYHNGFCQDIFFNGIDMIIENTGVKTGDEDLYIAKFFNNLG